MGELSITHLLIIFLIVLIFFGPGRLPALGKSLGEAIRGFKKGIDPNIQDNVAQQPARMEQLPPRTQEAPYRAQEPAYHTQEETGDRSTGKTI